METPYTCGLSPASGYSPVLVKFPAAVYAKGYRDLLEGRRDLFDEYRDLFEGSRDLLRRYRDLVKNAAVFTRRCRDLVKGAAVLSERGRSYLLAARGIC